MSERSSRAAPQPVLSAAWQALLHALLAGLLRILSVLPYAWVARIGGTLGALLYCLPSRRKRIVLVNLNLCFPGKSPAERDALGRAHFRQVLRSYLERGMQWFGSHRTIERLVQLESHIDLDDPAAPPTIFLGFHLVAIEVGCMRYSSRFPVTALYTPMSDKRLCALAARQRGRFGARMMPRSNSARSVLAQLRQGRSVMLASDMDFGLDNSVFAPFFGIPACTLVSVPRLARLARARVVPFVTEVLAGYQGYKMTIFEPLADFPSGDDAVDAARMNEFLERQIERLPDQYYWVHRRFKNRPAGAAPVY